MYYSGIILEIKDKYCLVMDNVGAVHRIVKKKGVKVGDKIYFLDEDIAIGDINISNKGKGGKIISSDNLRKILAIAAAVVIFIGSMGIVKYNNIAYAAISMDAQQSIQLELNRKGEVVAVSSFGKKLSKEEMERYEGLTMKQFWQLFAFENKNTKEPFMIGFVALKGGSETESKVEEDINKYMVGRNILILKGAKEDVDKANKGNISIGKYLLSTYDDNEKLEEFLENASKEEVEKYLKEHKNQISKKEANIIMSLKNKIDRENLLDEKDDDYYSDRDDDYNDRDDDDNDDYDADDDNINSKPIKPSKPVRPSKPSNNLDYEKDDDDDDNDDSDDSEDSEDSDDYDVED